MSGCDQKRRGCDVKELKPFSLSLSELRSALTVRASCQTASNNCSPLTRLPLDDAAAWVRGWRRWSPLDFVRGSQGAWRRGGEVIRRYSSVVCGGEPQSQRMDRRWGSCVLRHGLDAPLHSACPLLAPAHENVPLLPVPLLLLSMLLYLVSLRELHPENGWTHGGLRPSQTEDHGRAQSTSTSPPRGEERHAESAPGHFKVWE